MIYIRGFEKPASAKKETISSPDLNQQSSLANVKQNNFLINLSDPAEALFSRNKI